MGLFTALFGRISWDTEYLGIFSNPKQGLFQIIDCPDKMDSRFLVRKARVEECMGSSLHTPEWKNTAPNRFWKDTSTRSVSSTFKPRHTSTKIIIFMVERNMIASTDTWMAGFLTLLVTQCPKGLAKCHTKGRKGEGKSVLTFKNSKVRLQSIHKILLALVSHFPHVIRCTLNTRRRTCV